MIRIGNLKLKSDLLLAPMSGVSDFVTEKSLRNLNQP